MLAAKPDARVEHVGWRLRARRKTPRGPEARSAPIRAEAATEA